MVGRAGPGGNHSTSPSLPSSVPVALVLAQGSTMRKRLAALPAGGDDVDVSGVVGQVLGARERSGSDAVRARMRSGRVHNRCLGGGGGLRRFRKEK